MIDLTKFENIQDSIKGVIALGFRFYLDSRISKEVKDEYLAEIKNLFKDFV